MPTLGELGPQWQPGLDGLAALERNPAHPPEWWNRGVRNVVGGVARGLGDLAAFPGRYARGETGYTPGQMASEQPGATQWAPEMAMNMIGSPIASGVQVGGTLGIVPVDVAKRLNVTKSLPDSELFGTAVKNTKGARVEDGSLVLPIERRQHAAQELDDSVRGGVFYLPEGSKDAKYYTGTGHNFSYGGSQKVSGETAVNNPLFVKGATGGKAPATAYDQINGKGAYEAMRTEALRSTGSYNYGIPRELQIEATQRFLEKYAPEMAPLAEHILNNSKKGNQMVYALQEAAVASAARTAGHDAVVGYSVGRKTKQPFISEVFDVRENIYPSPAGDYGMWPKYKYGQ